LSVHSHTWREAAEALDQVQPFFIYDIPAANALDEASSLQPFTDPPFLDPRKGTSLYIPAGKEFAPHA